jgi:hypothetical protein
VARAAGKRAGGDTIPKGRSGDRVLRCEGSSPPGPGKKKRCSSVLSTCACRASSDHRRSIMIVVSKSSAPLLVPPDAFSHPPRQDHRSRGARRASGVRACGPLRRDVEAGEGTPSYCWSAGTARSRTRARCCSQGASAGPPD